MADQTIDPAAQEGVGESRAPGARPVSIKQMLSLAPADAIAFLEGKGYNITMNWQEMFHADHERYFTVAKVARDDLLATIRQSLVKAMADGTPFEQWREQLQPELERAGWWGTVQDQSLTGTSDPVFVGPRRLRTIYDTNLRTARASALWQRIQAGKEAMPFLRYSAVLDRRTRPLHRHWHGTVLPVDHPWWQTHFPPNGWQCRCTVVQMNQRMLDARGLKVSTPPNDGPPQLFRRKGDTAPVLVPRGIDPGFGYAPGNDYLQQLVARAMPNHVALMMANKDYQGWQPVRPVIPLQADAIFGDTGADVTGYSRMIGADFMRHAYARHGVGGAGIRPGAIGVTVEDMARLDGLLANAETYIVNGQVGGRKERRLVSTTVVDGYRFEIVERINPGKRSLTFTTIWKMPA